MTKTTNFVWDPLSDCVLTELDGTNTVQAVYTNEPQQYGGVLSQRRDTTTSTLHADALGTTRALTSSTQTTIDTYLYDAWGNLITSSGTTVNPFRWVGRYGYYQDASTGLVYVRARMYVATTARWASLDPIGHSGGINLFAYATNDAILQNDPSGMDLIPPGIPNLPKKVLEQMCLAWVAVEKSKSQDWLLDIPGCPCHVDCLDSDEWTTPAPEPTHPGAEVCTRSKNKSFLCKPGQQCCYSAGHLITGGPGAGTPDKISPEPKFPCAALHLVADVNSYFVCLGAGRLDLYLEVRPPNNRVGCEPWMS